MIFIFFLFLVIYFGFVFWLVRRYYLPWYKASISSGDSSGSPYRLSRLIGKILSFLHYLFLFIVISLPPYYLYATLVKVFSPEYGSYTIFVYSGFKLDFSLLPAIEASGLAQEKISGRTWLNMDASGHFIWHIYSLSRYIMNLIILYIVLQFRFVFASLSIGEAFTSINASRLKKIALVVIAWNVAVPLLQYLGWGAVLKEISINTQAIQLHPVFEPNIRAVLIGLALLVLSGVINEAVKMRDEQRLTI